MDKTFAKSEDFVQREIAGECLLIPLQRKLTDVNSLFVLNETGASFWRRLDGQATVQAIADDMCQEFEVASEQVIQDLSPLIDDLLSIQAIRQIPTE